MILERDGLQECRPGGGAAGWTDMACERRGAVGPDARGELLPLRPLFRNEAICQIGVQNRAERSAAEQGKRGIVAREQRAVQASANEAGRLPVEQPAQVPGLVRRHSGAGNSHAVRHG